MAYVVEEIVPGGELFDYIANSGPFSEEQCRYFFKQMVHGIHYLHTKGFAHRDLKPENIMLDADFNIKIVDFGFVIPLEGRKGDGNLTTYRGTFGYNAPEIYEETPYSGSVVDLFAMAVILFIMRAGRPPFKHAIPSDQLYRTIMDNKQDLFWKFHEKTAGGEGDHFSPEFKDLLTCMFQHQP